MAPDVDLYPAHRPQPPRLAEPEPEPGLWDGLLAAISVGVGLRPMVPAPRPTPLPQDAVVSTLRNALRRVAPETHTVGLADDPEIAPLIARVQAAAQQALPTLEAVDYFMADVERLAGLVHGGETTLERLPHWPEIFVSDARDVQHSHVVIAQCLAKLEAIVARAQGGNSRINDVELQAQHKRLKKTYSALCVDDTIVHAALDRLRVTAEERERVRESAVTALGQCLPLLFAKAESTRVSLQDPGLNKFDAGARVALAHKLYSLYVELCKPKPRSIAGYLSRHAVKRLGCPRLAKAKGRCR